MIRAGSARQKFLHLFKTSVESAEKWVKLSVVGGALGS